MTLEPTPPDAVDDRTPSELEARRREIVHLLTHQYNGYDDINVPLPLLQELAFLTSTLRRKNAGPPRRPAVKRTAGPVAALSVDEL